MQGLKVIHVIKGSPCDGERTGLDGTTDLCRNPKQDKAFDDNEYLSLMWGVHH